MKNFLPLSLVFILLILGCERISTPNEVLLDSQIPPEEKLIKLSARDLAEAFTRGKKRSSIQGNDADGKYSGKWLKVNGVIDSFSDKRDGFGYDITFDTFGGDPRVACAGNQQQGAPEINLRKNQKITVVGKLVSSGNASTLYLNPCKFIE